jgi:hypothetical protein
MAEPGSAAAVLHGVVLFLILLTAGLSVGLGLLSLLRVPADPIRRLLLAPYAATLFWALSGTLFVRLGASTRSAAPWIVGASAVLAAAGMLYFWRARRRFATATVAGYVAALLVVFALTALPYFQRGLAAHLGSPNLDTVNYTSVSAAMWRYGLDTPPNVPQYFDRLRVSVFRLGEARNNSFVLLGLFTMLEAPGEPLFVRNLFVCWSLLVLVFTLAFYRTTWNAPDDPCAEPINLFSLLYVVLTVGLGWATIPAFVGNWDNALLVSLGPALAGLAAEWSGERSHAPLLLGASLAFGVYTYTELAPLASLFVLPQFVRNLLPRATCTVIAIRYAGAIALALILLAPAANPLWRYFEHQRAAATRVTGGRPGGSFAGGLAVRADDPSAWWALGGEHGFAPGFAGRSAAIALTVFAFVGLVHIARRRRWAELGSLGLVTLSVSYFMFVDAYAYAIYKILSVSWWIVGLVVTEGFAVAFLAGRQSSAASPPAALYGRARTTALVLLVLACLVLSRNNRTISYFPGWIFEGQPTIPALVRLKAAASGQPPTDTLVPDVTGDGLVTPWIFYALKDSPLRLYHGPAVRTSVVGGAKWSVSNVLPATTLVSVAGLDGGRVRFRTPEFALVESDSVVVIERIGSPNGHEAWGTWLGTEPITISFWAMPGREIALTFDAEAGPSLPQLTRRRLTIVTSSGQRSQLEFDRKGTIVFPFVARGGNEVLTLSTPDAPTVAVFPNGDIRPLMVAVRNLDLAFRREAR